MRRESLRATFERDGYVVVPGFVDDAAVTALRRRAEQIVAAYGEASGSRFSARAEAGWEPDREFLTSGYAVRCFFEEDAFDERGELRVARELAINKIGHALHELDPVFTAFSHDRRLDELARAFGMREPLVYQSTYIFKQPQIGGEVRWHQDATYFVTEPQSVLAFWFALEDADRENGCLWAAPGGHRGPLRERFVVDGTTARLERIDETPWPHHNEAVALECASGTLIAMHGLLPHASAPNRSPRSRHAFTLHAVDGTARYSPRNWLQRTDVPARGFADSYRDAAPPQGAPVR